MSLSRNITWTFGGNVTYAASQWGMLVMLAKVTDVESVGIFSLSLALTAPVFAFTNLQLREIQATDVTNTYKHSEYIGFRSLSSILALIFILAMSIHYSDNLGKLLVILMVAVAKFIESCSDVMYGILQKYESMKEIAVSMIVKGVITFITFTVSVYLYNSIAISVATMVVVWLVLLIFADIRNVRLIIQKKNITEPLWPKFDKSKIIKILKFTYPMGVVIMLGSLSMNIPRYIVEAQMGEKALGYLSAIMYLVVAGNTVVGAVGQSATPRLAIYFNENLTAFRKLILTITGMAAAIGLLGVVISYSWGERILAIIYTPDYAMYTDVLILTMLLATILYCSSMLGRGITSARKFVSQAIIAPITSLIIFCVAYFTIPMAGLKGAVYCLIFGFFCKMVLESLVLIKLYTVQKIKLGASNTPSIESEITAENDRVKTCYENI